MFIFLDYCEYQNILNSSTRLITLFGYVVGLDVIKHWNTFHFTPTLEGVNKTICNGFPEVQLR